MNRYLNLWALIESDLTRARNTLPNATASDTVILQFHEFINNNEFELACDMLDAYSEEHLVTKDFWIALRDAAIKMQLPDRARRYE